MTAPALFSMPSTFMIGLGLNSVFLGIPQRSAVQISMKFSVVPLSTSALAVAIPCVCSKSTFIFNKFLWLTYMRSKDKARTQATRVEPSKKMEMPDCHS